MGSVFLFLRAKNSIFQNVLHTYFNFSFVAKNLEIFSHKHYFKLMNATFLMKISIFDFEADEKDGFHFISSSLNPSSGYML